MLHKLEENTDWRSKYQDALEQMEARELEWDNIENLLRKTIGRLSIAGCYEVRSIRKTGVAQRCDWRAAACAATT